jgi:hypothetical protein
VLQSAKKQLDVVATDEIRVKPFTPPLFLWRQLQAATVAMHTKAELLVLLTDVDGIYTAAPSEGGVLLDCYAPSTEGIIFGEGTCRFPLPTARVRSLVLSTCSLGLALLSVVEVFLVCAAFWGEGASFVRLVAGLFTAQPFDEV